MLAWRVTVLGLACVTLLARTESGVRLAWGLAPFAIAPWFVLRCATWVPWLRATISRVHRHFATRALPLDARASLPRAEALVDGPPVGRESVELARLHLERVEARVDWTSFEASVAAVDERLRLVARGVVVALVALVVVRGEDLAEGVAVLSANGSEARISLPAVRAASLRVRAPAYLRVPESTAPFEGSLVVFGGSELEVLARQRRADLDLVVTCGREVAPLASDGQGAVVLRRTVRESETWRIGRRVAGVFIPDGATLVIETARDSLPIVELKGAPKQLLLGETEREGGVALAYHAEDDHGLREVQLVLRSGTVEERRPLATLDGEHRSDNGASFVRTADPFFRKALGPVELRIEARDDGRDGARWGRSEAIVVVPPALGTAEAERFKSLVMLRDHEVDRLARRLVPTKEIGADPLAELLVDLEEEREEIAASLGTATLGLAVPAAVRNVVRRSAARLEALADNLPKREREAGRLEIVAATEDLVLDLDGALRQLAWSDAKTVARRLGQQVQTASDSIQAAAPVELGDNLARLESAARTLRALGPLGRDLGDLVEGDLARVKPLVAPEPSSAKLLLAALARRLARPDPSFGARGSGKGGTGDGRSEMSGEGQGDGSGGEGDAGDAAGRGAGASKGSAVDDLAEEQQMLHRAGEGLLRGGAMGDRDEREEHAKRLQAIGGADELRHGDGETQLRKAAELVRKGDFARARQAVNDVERGLPKAASRERTVLRNRLQDEGAWLDEQLHGDARVLADDEKRLAERTRELRRGARVEAVGKALDTTAEAMDRAARAFHEGKLAEGTTAQGEALDGLEAARDALQAEDGKGADDPAHAAVPRTDEARAAAWRRRVVDGLADRRATKVPDAVQRYEEGLLR